MKRHWEVAEHAVSVGEGVWMDVVLLDSRIRIRSVLELVNKPEPKS